MTLGLALVGCGPIPHPFETGRINPLLVSNRALVPLAVPPVPGADGLAEAMAAALAGEEIAASTDEMPTGFLLLRGTIETTSAVRAVLWQVLAPDGSLIGQSRQPLPTWPIREAGRRASVAAAARAVATLLLGDDSGVSDLDARPHIAVRPIQAAASFDRDGLARALADALSRQGLAVSSDEPKLFVDGMVHINPATGGQDQIDIDWVVRDVAGRELGTVSQSNKVAHDLLIGQLGPLAREIADAGAGGVAEVVRQVHPGP